MFGDLELLGLIDPGCDLPTTRDDAGQSCVVHHASWVILTHSRSNNTFLFSSTVHMIQSYTSILVPVTIRTKKLVNTKHEVVF